MYCLKQKQVKYCPSSIKVDNIVATFSRGLIPTGSQDPYALRRQTIGILNILLGSEWNISLRPIFKASMELLNVAADKQEEFA